MTMTREQVSILVLVEVLPWALVPPLRGEEHGHVSILVLVEVLPWARGKAPAPDPKRCFNPCSGGSIALGNCNLIRLGDLTTLFQSLFWWKYCPGKL